MLAGGVTRAFTYSASGNVTVDDAGGSAVTLTYNALDRLVQVGSGGIPLVDYVYAATGQRAIKATPLATTHYLHDPGGALYAETDGAGAVLREYITLGGATIAIIDPTGINYVHSDHLATPQVMTDGAAAVVWDASYRPFGEATIAGAAANQQRFPGQTADAETGYHDNWYRTYDPSLGRYIQSDPIGLAGGWNTYAYANGNPVMSSDRMGLRSAPGYGNTAGIMLAAGALAWATAYAICQNENFSPTIPISWIPWLANSGSDDDDDPFPRNHNDPSKKPFPKEPNNPNDRPPGFPVWPDWFGGDDQPTWTSGDAPSPWENATDHYFDHAGEFPEFSSAEEYIRAANEFAANPPPGTEVKTYPNGDVRLYHPPSNTFVSVNSNGVVKTMMRPTYGYNYWLTQ